MGKDLRGLLVTSEQMKFILSAEPTEAQEEYSIGLPTKYCRRTL
jgi:hypothetical protein